LLWEADESKPTLDRVVIHTPTHLETSARIDIVKTRSKLRQFQDNMEDADGSSHARFIFDAAGDRRCMGVDVRPRGFGFIVLEGITVLDCGSRMCRRSEARACLSHRFERLLESYRPSAIIMKTQPPRRASVVGSHSRIAASLRRVAKHAGIEVVDINTRAFRSYFAAHNAGTKYEIASAVAHFLPELAWKLPPQRKPWQSEHYRMSIFDAAAVALVHLNQGKPTTSVA